VKRDAVSLTGARAGVRRQALLRRPANRAHALQSADGDATTTAPAVTGFLLRSRVVRGWPGLEVSGWSGAPADAPLRILRMDRLGASILLCLFDGDVARVDIHEPAEGLHFGFKPVPTDSDGSKKQYSKLVEHLSDTPVQIDVPFRKCRRVLDVARLADQIRRSVPVRVTPAELGLVMVQRVGAMAFSFDGSKEAARGE